MFESLEIYGHVSKVGDKNPHFLGLDYRKPGLPLQSPLEIVGKGLFQEVTAEKGCVPLGANMINSVCGASKQMEKTK